MSLPIPRPGLVIRYSFLWSNEKAKRAAEGAKDRPCAIIVATRRGTDSTAYRNVRAVDHYVDTEAEIPALVAREVAARF